MVLLVPATVAVVAGLWARGQGRRAWPYALAGFLGTVLLLRVVLAATSR